MVFFVNIIVIFTEYQYLNLEHVTKVTESVTLDEFCNFLFYSFIVNIITKLQHTEQSAMQKNVERDVTIMANRINLNGTSYHGAGAIAEIANEAKAHCFQKSICVF